MRLPFLLLVFWFRQATAFQVRHPTRIQPYPHSRSPFPAALDSQWEEQDHDDSESVEDDQSPLDEEYSTWKSSLTKAIRGLEKKIRSLENEKDKASKIEDTMARAQLITSFIYMFQPGVRSATVQDWENDGKEIELVLDDKYSSASEEADALFTQARKLKRGSAVVGELLDESKAAMDTLMEIQMDLDSLQPGSIDVDQLRLLQDRMISTSRKTGFQAPEQDESSSQKRYSGANPGNRKPPIGTPASNIRKLESPGGCVILVGRNRRGNEYLSMTIARGDDLWMHSRGVPGAHVLVQQRRGSPKATDECIQFAANLAIFYSDARTERKGIVTVAEPKHLQKPRRAPLGAVKLREELMTVTGFPDDVPEELKEARDESGQLGEYRSQDKAKHRRQTKERVTEERAKRKAKKNST